MNNSKTPEEFNPTAGPSTSQSPPLPPPSPKSSIKHTLLVPSNATASSSSSSLASTSTNTSINIVNKNINTNTKKVLPIWLAPPARKSAPVFSSSWKFDDEGEKEKEKEESRKKKVAIGKISIKKNNKGKGKEEVIEKTVGKKSKSSSTSSSSSSKVASTSSTTTTKNIIPSKKGKEKALPNSKSRSSTSIPTLGRKKKLPIYTYTDSDSSDLEPEQHDDSNTPLMAGPNAIRLSQSTTLISTRNSNSIWSNYLSTIISFSLQQQKQQKLEKEAEEISKINEEELVVQKKLESDKKRSLEILEKIRVRNLLLREEKLRIEKEEELEVKRKKEIEEQEEREKERLRLLKEKALEEELWREEGSLFVERQEERGMEVDFQDIEHLDGQEVIVEDEMNEEEAMDLDSLSDDEHADDQTLISLPTSIVKEEINPIISTSTSNSNSTPKRPTAISLLDDLIPSSAPNSIHNREVATDQFLDGLGLELNFTTSTTTSNKNPLPSSEILPSTTINPSKLPESLSSRKLSINTSSLSGPVPASISNKWTTLFVDDFPIDFTTAKIWNLVTSMSSTSSSSTSTSGTETTSKSSNFFPDPIGIKIQKSYHLNDSTSLVILSYKNSSEADLAFKNLKILNLNSGGNSIRPRFPSSNFNPTKWNWGEISLIFKESFLLDQQQIRRDREEEKNRILIKDSSSRSIDGSGERDARWADTNLGNSNNKLKRIREDSPGINSFGRVTRLRSRSPTPPHTSTSNSYNRRNSSPVRGREMVGRFRERSRSPERRSSSNFIENTIGPRFAPAAVVASQISSRARSRSPPRGRPSDGRSRSPIRFRSISPLSRRRQQLDKNNEDTRTSTSTSTSTSNNRTDHREAGEDDLVPIEITSKLELLNVRNLPPQVTIQQMRQYFPNSVTGIIISSKIIKGKIKSSSNALLAFENFNNLTKLISSHIKGCRFPGVKSMTLVGDRNVDSLNPQWRWSDFTEAFRKKRFDKKKSVEEVVVDVNRNSNDSRRSSSSTLNVGTGSNRIVKDDRYAVSTPYDRSRLSLPSKLESPTKVKINSSTSNSPIFKSPIQLPPPLPVIKSSHNTIPTLASSTSAVPLKRSRLPPTKVLNSTLPARQVPSRLPSHLPSRLPSRLPLSLSLSPPPKPQPSAPTTAIAPPPPAAIGLPTIPLSTNLPTIPNQSTLNQLLASFNSTAPVLARDNSLDFLNELLPLSFPTQPTSTNSAVLKEFNPLAFEEENPLLPLYVGGSRSGSIATHRENYRNGILQEEAYNPSFPGILRLGGTFNNHGQEGMNRDGSYDGRKL